MCLALTPPPLSNDFNIPKWETLELFFLCDGVWLVKGKVGQEMEPVLY